mmetsp:Transcript_72004/g.125005  ORF Transcript_72004/g.125005 Transcript_72004/m.125005 type:complete len:223 (-) Transcript_72004:1262-1930(-)
MPLHRLLVKEPLTQIHSVLQSLFGAHEQLEKIHVVILVFFYTMGNCMCFVKSVHYRHVWPSTRLVFFVHESVVLLQQCVFQLWIAHRSPFALFLLLGSVLPSPFIFTLRFPTLLRKPGLPPCIVEMEDDHTENSESCGEEEGLDEPPYINTIRIVIIRLCPSLHHGTVSNGPPEHVVQAVRQEKSRCLAHELDQCIDNCLVALEEKHYLLTPAGLGRNHRGF